MIGKLVRKVSSRRLSVGSVGSSSSSGSRCDAKKNVVLWKKAAKLIEKRRWGRLRELLASAPPRRIAEELTPEDGCARDPSLLHALCGQNPPLDLVETLAALIPAVLDRVDYLDRTALHVAVLEGASVDVVGCLLRSCRGLAERRDAEGKTPLVLACEQFGLAGCDLIFLESDARMGHFASVIELLVTEGGPRSVAIEDAYGKAALEYAVLSRVPSRLIRLLREATAEAHRRMEEALALKRRHELIFEMKLTDLASRESHAGTSGRGYSGCTVVAVGA